MQKMIWIALLAVSAPVAAQSSAAPQPAEQQPVPSHGTVIFSRSDDQPASPTEHDVEAAASLIALSDSQRDAVTFTKYALDVHLTPAGSALAVHARMTVRNDSDVPLPYLPLRSRRHCNGRALR